MRRGAIAAPHERPREAAEIREGNDLAKLPVERAQRPEFLFQHREELPLDVVENFREFEHPALRSSDAYTVPSNIGKIPLWPRF